MRRSIWVGLLAGAIGCTNAVSTSTRDAGAEPGDAGTDAGHVRDAGEPRDAGETPEDAGPSDAGLEPSDAGPRDAGSPFDAGPEDAGSPVDAGGTGTGTGSFEDAGSGGSGSALDAGGTGTGTGSAPDAGGTGSGSTIDAGPPDAGPIVLDIDAGTPDTFVTPDLTQPGAAVPDDFLGISVEWSHVPDYLGDTQGNVRPQVIQLLSQFAADGHHPVLRIGGDSEDQSWWNPDGDPLPSGATVSVTNTHLSILNAINQATGSRFVLGLNLAISKSGNASQLVAAALAALPTGAVEAFEVGNEPDLYFYPSGYRDFYYSAFFYEQDFEGYFPDLSNASGGAALFAAPAFYGTSWYSSLRGFLSDEQGRLGLVTMHRYPYDVCITSATAPTIADLFSDTATTQYATQFAPVVQTAARTGLGLRVAEMNSVSCGGTEGVSDVFASGLWGADAMFELASVGAVGANFHTPSHYAVFDFDGSGALEVRGLYYGMLLFSRATAQQGKWLPVTVSSSHQVRAWGTLGADGALRVAVINEDLQHPAVVRVLGAGPQAAQVWHLSAPSLDTATAITFGQQTWDGSMDGNPTGSPDGDVTYVRSDGQYQLEMGPGSAAVIAIPQ